MIDRHDVLAILGCLILLAGLVVIDWRIAVVVSGAVLFVTGVVGGAQRPAKRR